MHVSACVPKCVSVSCTSEHMSVCWSEFLSRCVCEGVWPVQACACGFVGVSVHEWEAWGEENASGMVACLTWP